MSVEDPVLSDATKWVIGIIVTLVGGAITQLHVRLNRSDDKVSGLETRMQHEMSEGDRQLWVELRAQQADATAFRERMLTNMATKTDLRDVERRIIAALNGNKRFDDAGQL